MGSYFEMSWNLDVGLFRSGSTPAINAISFLLIVGTSLATLVQLYFSKKDS